jgi:hypothetical protein
MAKPSEHRRQRSKEQKERRQLCDATPWRPSVPPLPSPQRLVCTRKPNRRISQCGSALSPERGRNVSYQQVVVLIRLAADNDELGRRRRRAVGRRGVVQGQQPGPGLLQRSAKRRRGRRCRGTRRTEQPATRCARRPWGAGTVCGFWVHRGGGGAWKQEATARGHRLQVTAQ